MQQSNQSAAIYLVTSDLLTGNQLKAALSGMQWPLHDYYTLDEFVGAAHPPVRGCLLTSLDNLDISLEQLLEKLAPYEDQLALILLSHELEVAQVVAAIRAGVIDVLQLPPIERVLRRQVHKTIARLCESANKA